MCHAAGSAPPSPGREGGGDGHHPAVNGVDTHLVSGDGTRFLGYLATPAAVQARAGVVILPDMRGLHGFYKALARQFAELGIAALAIDYFGRNLPDDERTRPAEEMMPLVMALSPEQVAMDARAATDALLSGGATTVFSVGFCFGGSQAWIQSALDDRLAGCVGFYGRPADCRPFLPRMSVPLLLLAAGQDFMTPAEDFGVFDEELSAAGVEHDLVMYPDAPHAFFDGAAGYDTESADAWRRLIAFLSDRAAAHGVTIPHSAH